MASSCTSRYRLLVTGRLPKTLTGLLADRFGPTAVIATDARRTVLEIDADQAGLRALLTLLWDVGHDVQSMCRSEDPPQPAGE